MRQLLGLQLLATRQARAGSSEAATARTPACSPRTAPSIQDITQQLYCTAQAAHREHAARRRPQHYASVLWLDRPCAHCHWRAPTNAISVSEHCGIVSGIQVCRICSLP